MIAAAALLQPIPEADLRAQILAADEILFERAFNECDLAALHDILLPEVEMIHDQAGMNQGRDAFMRPVRENICNGGPQKPIRRLVGESMEVYPLYENGRLYGAIQRGEHEFFIREEGQPLLLTNRARYSHVWLLETGDWKLKSALSWDHLNPNENSPLDADVLSAGFDRNDELLRLLSAHDIAAQNVAIVRGGVLVEERAAGRATPSRKAATDTIFNVASLAKPVSAMVALRLVDAGLLDLDEPLAPYWTDPDLEGSPLAGQITARHVLSHTSGLPNWRYLDEEGGGRLRFLSEPGTSYAYSGEGFEWLRRAIEMKTGASWETLARRHVFEPARMTSTSFLYPAASSDLVAARYDATGRMIESEPHSEANAAANLMTTSGDYARFVIFAMNGGGLSSELATDMLSPQVVTGPKKAFSLGWELIEEVQGDEVVMQHSGSDAGVRSLAIAYLSSGDAIVILSNSEASIPSWGLILKEAFGPAGEEVVRRNR